MPCIFRSKDLKFEKRTARLPRFEWHTSPRLHELVGAKHISKLDVRSLDPGKYSFPYHFHRAAEELFLVLSGEATLRSPKGFETIASGDIVFMEAGPEGAHQLFNHGAAPCVYVDVNVATGPDVIEYPDSGKIGTGGAFWTQGSAVDYYEGEADVASKWKTARRGGR